MKKPWVMAAVITVVFAIISFILGPVLWPMPEGGISPVGLQLPLFIVIGALESVAFGLGMAFLILGWKLCRGVPAALQRSMFVFFISIGWSLVSWWPHDRMHMSNGGENLWGLLLIEYLFHVSLIVSAIVIACEFTVICRYLAKK